MSMKKVAVETEVLQSSPTHRFYPDFINSLSYLLRTAEDAERRDINVYYEVSVHLRVKAVLSEGYLKDVINCN